MATGDGDPRLRRDAISTRSLAPKLQLLLLALLAALVAALLVLLLDASWREAEDRTQAHISAAWQTLASKASGNTGVLHALEYLNSTQTDFCFFGYCLRRLKRRVPLDGVDLSLSESLQEGRASDSASGLFLRGLDLRQADLQRSNFNGADLDGAYFSNANMERAKLNQASLVQADFEAANLMHASFFRANLQEANLSRTNLIGASLAGAYLFRSNLQGADLSEASLVAADLRGVNLVEAKLGKASLLHTNLADARLSASDANGVDLRWANLHGAQLDGTDLTEANLEGADLSGALFLTQEQLNSARGDATTKLPEADSDGNALVRPSSWGTGSSSEPDRRATSGHPSMASQREASRIRT